MKTLFACSLIGLISGCATIVHGTHQNVGFTSVPPGAKVYVDSMPFGQTPVIVPIERGTDHIVRMELTGYEDFDTTLTSTVSGWVWGNLLFTPIGTVVGFAVDLGSGGNSKLSPEQVSGVLQPDTKKTAFVPKPYDPTGRSLEVR